ncbi:MAG: hypothetical protein CMI52_02575 [Parcubacteria group bacterium]|nr:hypothetical protein [Parcubacteria group bacterium]
MSFTDDVMRLLKQCKREWRKCNDYTISTSVRAKLTQAEVKRIQSVLAMLRMCIPHLPADQKKELHEALRKFLRTFASPKKTDDSEQVEKIRVALNWTMRELREKAEKDVPAQALQLAQPTVKTSDAGMWENILNELRKINKRFQKHRKHDSKYDPPSSQQSNWIFQVSSILFVVRRMGSCMRPHELKKLIDELTEIRDDGELLGNGHVGMAWEMFRQPFNLAIKILKKTASSGDRDTMLACWQKIIRSTTTNNVLNYGNNHAFGKGIAQAAKFTLPDMSKDERAQLQKDALKCMEGATGTLHEDLRVAVCAAIIRAIKRTPKAEHPQLAYFA